MLDREEIFINIKAQEIRMGFRVGLNEFEIEATVICDEIVAGELLSKFGQKFAP